jgi:sec-independent protein translocase protein TatB
MTGGAIVPFDLSMWKLMVLGVIALVVFGPERLPQLARDAGRTLRQLRAMAQTARTELKAELGDTVGEFDFSDLNPRNFVRKHLLDDLDSDLESPAPGRSPGTNTASTTTTGGSPSPAPAAFSALTEPAPYDLDAT